MSSYEHPDPRVRSRMNQSIPTLTTWPEVVRHIIIPLSEYPPSRDVSSSFVHGASFFEGLADEYFSSKFSKSFPSPSSSSSSCKHPPYESYLRSTMYETFVHLRSFVLVSFRDGELYGMWQVVNKDFRNDWGSDVQLVDAKKQHVSDVGAFINAKKRAGVQEKSSMIYDIHRWWTNGSVVCNVPPSNIWGDGFISDLREMFSCTASSVSVPSVDVVLNRRDFPLYTIGSRELDEPNAHALGRSTRKRDRPSEFVQTVFSGIPRMPVIGFYSGNFFSDVCIPVAEDWKLAKRLEKDGELSTKPWGERKPVAVFRGSNTGRSSVRLNLSTKKLKSLDAAITDASKRDWLVGGVLGCSDYTSTQKNIDLKNRMSMEEQFQQFRYVIYVPGHSAASRMGMLLASQCTLIRVKGSAQTCPADQLWLDSFIFPFRWWDHPTCTPHQVGDETHIEVQEDLSDLESALQWVISNDQAAQKIAQNAFRRARQIISTSFIKRYIQLLLAQASEQSLSHTNTEHVPCWSRIYMVGPHNRAPSY